MVDGTIDYFRAMLVFGVPFGIPYMFTVIPIGGDTSWCLGILVLNIVLGALFGCAIAVGILVKAIGGVFVMVCLFGQKR